MPKLLEVKHATASMVLWRSLGPVLTAGAVEPILIIDGVEGKEMAWIVTAMVERDVMG
jgi:hypothetical protein